MSEREVFIEALQRTDPGERSSYLDQACAGDEALRRRVEQLLEAHTGASEILRGPAPFAARTAEFVPQLSDDTPLASPAERCPVLISTEDSSVWPVGANAPPKHSRDEPSETNGRSDRTGSGHAVVFDGAGLSQFELLAELGRGGMGVVYKARHRPLNRIVALKMISEGKHASPEMRERFLIEAEAVARLRHPNIVQIYDIGEVDGHPYGHGSKTPVFG
jgi:hypothetical protein